MLAYSMKNDHATEKNQSTQPLLSASFLQAQSSERLQALVQHYEALIHSGRSHHSDVLALIDCEQELAQRAARRGKASLWQGYFHNEIS